MQKASQVPTDSFSFTTSDPEAPTSVEAGVSRISAEQHRILVRNLDRLNLRSVRMLQVTARYLLGTRHVSFELRPGAGSATPADRMPARRLPNKSDS